MTPTILNNRYQILRELADGGFGKTFLAEDTLMPSGRRCVVKQLKPVNANPQLYQWVKDKFQREASLLEDLGDRNDRIPRLYAYFTENDEFYLVEEWIQGQTLTDKVQQEGILPEAKVKEILSEVLRILEYIQAKGIIHRDIKPDNIILRFADGKPVLIDFGAVKETMGTIVTASGRSTSSVVIGTPGYMPAEQSGGRPVFASDLYSLGLSAIYLLTNKQPQELQTDVQTGEILWRQYAPSISHSFAEILDRSIQPHARDRYLNAKSMLEALESMSQVIPDTILDVKPRPNPVYTEPAQTIRVTPASPPPQGTPVYYNQAEDRSVPNPPNNSNNLNNNFNYAPSPNNNQRNLFIYAGIGVASVIGLIALVATQPNLQKQLSGDSTTTERGDQTDQASSNSPPPDSSSNPSDSASTTSIPPSWASYKAYDSSYTVAFPQKPNEKKDYLDTAVGKVYFVEAAYSDNNYYYSTSHTTYPVDPKQYDPETGLSGSRDGISKSINMPVVREEKITINGFPAREVEMKGKDGALLAHLILDPNGPTLYQVFVVSSNGNVNTEEAKAFINSFSLQRQ
jgi:serine/threonine protein kinase, bacterial